MINIDVSFFLHFLLIAIACKLIRMCFFDLLYDILFSERKNIIALNNELSKESLYFDNLKILACKEKKTVFIELKQKIENINYNKINTFYVEKYRKRNNIIKEIQMFQLKEYVSKLFIYSLKKIE